MDVKQGQFATYHAAMAVGGWSIVMTTADGDRVLVEFGIRSPTRAQKRVEYWTKKEAEAVKNFAGSR
jgi:hypothetical protein